MATNFEVKRVWNATARLCRSRAAVMGERAETLPTVGTFIRPVGPFGFRYCVQVKEVFLPMRVQGNRWGMLGKRPHNDGHVERGANSCIDLLPLRSGVWKTPQSEWRDVVYWVEVASDKPRQSDLFGAP